MWRIRASFAKVRVVAPRGVRDDQTCTDVGLRRAVKAKPRPGSPPLKELGLVAFVHVQELLAQRCQRAPKRCSSKGHGLLASLSDLDRRLVAVAT